jgi:hypothetical protein
MVELNPLAPGEETSAFKEKRFAQQFGAALMIAGTVLGELNTVFPGSKWVGIALIVVGGLKSIAGTLGYIQGRATITAAAISTNSLPMSNQPKV